jgi:hypothetical protein
VARRESRRGLEPLLYPVLLPAGALLFDGSLTIAECPPVLTVASMPRPHRYSLFSRQRLLGEMRIFISLLQYPVP